MIAESVLRDLYLTQKLTESEIGARYKCTQMQVNRLRKAYGIDTISKADRFNLPTLSTPQVSLLLGSLFGDARLLRTGSKTAALSEYHSLKQEGYLEWKSKLWGQQVRSIRHIRTLKHGKEFTGNLLRTHASRELYPYWQAAYPSGAGFKTFTHLDLSPFDALSLAVWYLDDGGKMMNGYVRFAVTPEEASQEIQMALLRRFGLDPRLHKGKDSDASISLHDRGSLTRFLDLVAPHVPPCMDYKLELLPRSRGLAPRAILTKSVLNAYIEAGRSIPWIAMATGTSDSSVRRALLTHGIQESSLSPPTWEEAKGRIQSGLDDEQLLDVLVSLPMPDSPGLGKLSRDFDNVRARTLAKVEGGFVHGGGTVGLTLCQALFPHRFDATRGEKPSVRGAWFDREEIRKAVAFQRKVGDPVYPKNVFRALRALLTAPSNFRPAVAKRLVAEFSPENGLVLDPCAGYGGRAVGTIAAGRRYLGVDPHPAAAKSFASLHEIIGGDLVFHNKAFEDITLTHVEADLVFTSPPYFSVERYSNDPSQSWVRYPTWSLWVDRFLRVLIAKSFNCLRPGGRMLLNVADSVLDGGDRIPLVQTSLDLAKEYGFTHEGTLQMVLGIFGRKRRGEPILVLRKEGEGRCSVPHHTLPKGPNKLDTFSTGISGLDEETLRDLYAVQLLTDAEIAKRFKVSDGLVSQQRKRWGIFTMSLRQRADKVRGGLSISDLTPSKLADLYARMGDRPIAALYGVSKPTITKLRRGWGIASIQKSDRI